LSELLLNTKKTDGIWTPDATEKRHFTNIIAGIIDLNCPGQGENAENLPFEQVGTRNAN
jgi:hypothetical protein